MAQCWPSAAEAGPALCRGSASPGIGGGFLCSGVMMMGGGGRAWPVPGHQFIPRCECGGMRAPPSPPPPITPVTHWVMPVTAYGGPARASPFVCAPMTPIPLCSNIVSYLRILRLAWIGVVWVLILFIDISFRGYLDPIIVSRSVYFHVDGLAFKLLSHLTTRTKQSIKAAVTHWLLTVTIMTLWCGCTFG